VFLHATVDGVLWYRSRPNGHDLECCIFDMFSLQRYGEGKAPDAKREFYAKKVQKACIHERLAGQGPI
jgi:hypothetical protein